MKWILMTVPVTYDDNLELHCTNIEDHIGQKPKSFEYQLENAFNKKHLKYLHKATPEKGRSVTYP